MKKIILLLVFSLGLVSAVNAESVCEEVSCIYRGADRVAQMLEANFSKEEEKLKADWGRKLNRCYMAEIKRSDKETLCLYTTTAITDYLKTSLTPQEIERFERYLVKVGYYKSYESNKDDYLNALKFLKHFNKIEYWYKKYDENYHNDNVQGIMRDFATEVVKELPHPAVLVDVERFVYDENLGNFFEFQENRGAVSLDYMKEKLKEFEKSNSCKNIGYYREDCHKAKDLKYVIQWAESKLKESKQKGGKNE